MERIYRLQHNLTKKKTTIVTDSSDWFGFNAATGEKATQLRKKLRPALEAWIEKKPPTM